MPKTQVISWVHLLARRLRLIAVGGLFLSYVWGPFTWGLLLVNVVDGLFWLWVPAPFSRVTLQRYVFVEAKWFSLNN